jgi:hypothetical protein
MKMKGSKERKFKRVYSHKNIHTRKIENTLENNNLNNSMNMGFNIKSGKDYNNFKENYDEIIQKNYKTHNLNKISNDDLKDNSEKNSINYTINNINNKLISFGNSDYKFKTENVSNKKLIKRDSLDIEELNTIKFNKISDFNISNNVGDLILSYIRTYALLDGNPCDIRYCEYVYTSIPYCLAAFFSITQPR